MPASVTLNLKDFETKMSNIVKYSDGFIDGISMGKKQFINNLAISTINALYQFIDSSARSNRDALHHVYEWYRTGSPSARLFDFNYSVSEYGLSISSSFKQSRSVSENSTVPFYNKARIMEEGIPVKISPKNKVLAFNVGGETVFTSKEVVVENPGGNAVQGSFERVFDQFMLQYFKQSFLKASGLYDYIENPTEYKKNLKLGSKRGRPHGIKTGYSWIANAKVGDE